MINLSDILDEFNVVIDTPEGLTELRSLILGLAVRGKLVPQDHNDEPASELLKKIETKKKRLYDEGDIRKPRKLKDLDEDEIPYELPKTWLWCRIGDVAKIQGGGTPKTSETKNWSDKGIPWVTPADFNVVNSKYICRGKRDISEEGLSSSSTFLLPKGSVLFSSRAPIGYVAIAENDICTNQGFQSSIPYLLSTNEYIYYYLKYIGKIIDERASGTTFKEVSGTFVANVEFPLPPIAEQHRIVQKIETLFAEVDELETKLNRQSKLDEKLQLAVNAEVQKAPDAEASKTAWNFITSNFDTLYHTPEAIDNLKKNILNEAVRGRLVPQNLNDEPASELLKKIEAEKERLYDEGEIRKPKDLPPVKESEIPFEIPEGWEWTRVEIVGITQTGTTPKTSNSEFYGDYIPFVGPGDMSVDEIDYSNNGLSEKGLEVGRLIPKGSILMVCIGGSIGKSHIVDRDVSCNQQINTIFPIAGISSHYIKSVFRSDYFQKAILSKSTGSATPIINRTKWGNIPISLPPLEEQDRIVRRIEDLFAICDRFKAQLEQRKKVNEKLVKGLMSEVLEG